MRALFAEWHMDGGRPTMGTALTSQAQPNPLLRKLTSIAEINEEERQAVLDLPMNVKVFDADMDIVQDGDRPTECVLILTGFVCRYKLLADGKRQIMGFYIPGDIPDLQSLHLHVMDHNVSTLAKSSVALIPHQPLRHMLQRFPVLNDVFWRDTLIDGAIFRQWMIGLGRRSAYQRMAHLLCELHDRMKAVGLVQENGLDLPVTQNEFADSLGLSTVHVNRVLQDLRRDRLIILRGGLLSIPDWEALKEVAEFDPVYLHLKR